MATRPCHSLVFLTITSNLSKQMMFAACAQSGPSRHNEACAQPSCHRWLWCLHGHAWLPSSLWPKGAHCPPPAVTHCYSPLTSMGSAVALPLQAQLDQIDLFE